MTNQTDSNITKYTNKLGITTVPISSAANTVIRVCMSGAVPCLHGDAGIGKTAIAEQIAQQLKAHAFVAKTMSECQPEDLGIPFADDEDPKYFGMKLPEWIKPIFEAGKLGLPSVLFLDEVTRASEAVSTIMFNILTERRLHGHPLPENCYLMAACNPDNGDYAVKDIMSDFAWRRRLKHYYAVHSVSGWLKYARKVSMHKYVIEYIESNVDALMDDKARSAGKVYGNPAAWHEVSNFLHANGGLLDASILAGYINYDMASDFVSFTEDSEFKLPPKVVVSSYAKASPILAKMEEAGRADLVSRLTTSVAMYVMDNQPETETTASNIVKFWASLGSEHKMKFSHELNRFKNKTESNYYHMLMGQISQKPLWKSKIFPEIKSIHLG